MHKDLFFIHKKPTFIYFEFKNLFRNSINKHS
jgi:hypothetical protein